MLVMDTYFLFYKMGMSLKEQFAPPVGTFRARHEYDDLFVRNRAQCDIRQFNIIRSTYLLRWTALNLSEDETTQGGTRIRWT